MPNLKNTDSTWKKKIEDLNIHDNTSQAFSDIYQELNKEKNKQVNQLVQNINLEKKIEDITKTTIDLYQKTLPNRLQ